MGELKRNRAIVGGAARKVTLVLGAALVSVALAACGDGDSNAYLAEAINAGPSSGANAGASSDAGSAASSGVGASSGAGAGSGAGSGSEAGSRDSGPPATLASAPGATTLSWTPPTINEDGTPLKLTGYRIYWGQADDYFPYSVTLDNPGLTRYVVDQLSPAKWYFTATALSEKGESSFSNVIAMQVR
jgi:hypothetical protein